jgi:hypothetical protein
LCTLADATLMNRPVMALRPMPGAVALTVFFVAAFFLVAMEMRFHQATTGRSG